tara:strand:+ start:162 stop:392 length:231 start_codon:yes stop_codon:yes gene_type:complete
MVQITAEQLGVEAAVRVGAVRQSLLRVALVAVKADIFSPDRVGLAVQAALRRGFLVVVVAMGVLKETLVGMTLVDL